MIGTNGASRATSGGAGRAIGCRAALTGAVALTAVLLAGCGGGGAGRDAPVIGITAVDYAFEPATLSIAPGTVTFRVENTGAQEHELEIMQGDTVVDEVEGLVPGLTKEMTVTLAPGTYRYVCRLADHEQRGMVGTLTVGG